MRVLAGSMLIVAFALAGALPRGLADARRPGDGTPPPPAVLVRGAMERLPAAFEENRGQADAGVRFLARARGYRAFFTDDEALFVLPRGTGRRIDGPGEEPRPSAGADLVRMRFVGAKPAPPRAVGAPLPGVHHYLLGNDESRWVRDVPRFGGILGRNAWPGIDLRWRGLPGGRLEYDFLLAPGADPGLLRMEFAGAASLEVDGRGDLLVATRGGVLRHKRPVAWQDLGGRRAPVEAAFRLAGGGTVALVLGRYDPAAPVVVDPELIYSTYLGGIGLEDIDAIVIDSSDRPCIAGRTGSTSFPVVDGFQATRGGNDDAFVAVFAADGQSLAYATFLGGASDELADALALDGDGLLVAAGWTTSTNFPTKSAIRTYSAGDRDAFVTKFAADGGSLVFSTYLGGGFDDSATGIAVDGAGAIYVAGPTKSSDFPTTPSSFQPALGGPGAADAFLFKLPANGSSLTWSTYLGGAGEESCYALALDGSGAPILVGSTTSSAFPLQDPVKGTYGPGRDGYVTCVDPDGATLLWSTFMGGGGSEFLTGVAVAPSGAVWICGQTDSTDYPSTGGYQQAKAGMTDGVVTRLEGDGSGIQMSTYFGGTQQDALRSVCVDGSGSACVVGYSESTNFPLIGPVQGTKGGNFDVVAALFRETSPVPHFSTVLGGSGDDRGEAVALDSKGHIIVGGYSYAGTNYPMKDPYQGTFSDGWDAILSSIERLPPAPPYVGVKLVALRAAQIDWTDPGVGQDGFRLERSVDGGPFAEIASLPGDVLSAVDGNLVPDTLYVYRLRTDAGGYLSDPSEEASIRTPPPPTSAPLAPSSMAAVVVSPRRVDLTWQDNSDTEDFFLLSRAPGAALFSTLATPQLGVTAWSDGTVLPGRTYSWKVRAVNPTGSSLDSNTVTATMPTSLVIDLVKGKVTDKEAARRDSLVLSGTFAFGEDSLASAFDPAGQSLELRLGDMEAGTLLRIAAGDEGWKVKKGKYTWKSPSWDLTRARVVVDPVAKTWSLVLKKLTYAAVPANPLRFTLSIGEEAGYREADWTPGRKAGQFKYP